MSVGCSVFGAKKGPFASIKFGVRCQMAMRYRSKYVVVLCLQLRSNNEKNKGERETYKSGVQIGYQTDATLSIPISGQNSGDILYM